MSNHYSEQSDEPLFDIRRSDIKDSAVEVQLNYVFLCLTFFFKGTCSTVRVSPEESSRWLKELLSCALNLLSISLVTRILTVSLL